MGAKEPAEEEVVCCGDEDWGEDDECELDTVFI